MKTVIIIKTGNTFKEIIPDMGNFEDWIIRGLGLPADSVRVVDVTKGEALPQVQSVAGIVVAGSHAMVTRNYAWSLAVEEWLPPLIDMNIPVLGICYGHQLLARAMGGVVDYHAGGSEAGTVAIDLLDVCESDPLFNNLPRQFKVHASHSQTVTRLPEHAVLLAKNDFEPTHVFRVGKMAWGFQFHPEYTEEIVAVYAKKMESSLHESQGSLTEILEGIEPTPVAAKILKRFGKLCW